MSSKAWIALAVVVIGGGLVFAGVMMNNSDDGEDQDTTSQTEQTTQDESQPAQEVSTFTAEEVAVHDSEDDCWMIIETSVYDVTEYIPGHPGREAILLACGKDGTTLFQERTTENGEPVGSGTPHSASANSFLDDYFIGELEPVL